MNGEKRTYYIKHTQRVTFDVPVFCEPMLIRLHPRIDDLTHVRSSRLDITPLPASLRRVTDLAGNFAWQATFDTITVSLTITATSCVEREAASASALARTHISGLNTPPHEDPELVSCYLRRQSDSPEVAELARDVGRIGNERGWDLLARLTREVAQQYQWEAYCGSPSRVRQAGRLGGHDLRTRAAELLAEVSREHQIPARIVRGYNAAEADEIDTEMAIWTECYLAGWGWHGLDPCGGHPADQRYIPVAVGRSADGTTSVRGNYRGTSRRPESSTQIILREAAEPGPIAPPKTVRTSPTRRPR